MPGLFPNPSAAPENFRVGDQVKYWISEREISPYVGTVTAIAPGIHKVWVEWPVGGNQQMDPETLIMITPFAGKSTVKEESGYSNYDKAVSRQDYGSFKQPNVVRLAKKIIMDQVKAKEERENFSKMASQVAHDFATNVIDKIAADVVDCREQNMNEVFAYQTLYSKYGSVCSDHILRFAIEKVYELAETSQDEKDPQS